jgi:[ribosomal protein S5]-alanine N-acetyltransferase
MPLVLARCTVRPWRLEDAEALPKHANNRQVSLRLRDRFPYPYTLDDAKAFLPEALAQPPTRFCIEINGEVAGGIGLEVGADVHRHTAEFGYWLGEPFWGKGIMTEVVGAFVDYCFSNFSLHRLCAQTFSNNPASARVLEKNGFVFEGRLKNNVFKNGEMLDSLVYARFK